MSEPIEVPGSDPNPRFVPFGVREQLQYRSSEKLALAHARWPVWVHLLGITSGVGAAVFGAIVVLFLLGP